MKFIVGIIVGLLLAAAIPLVVVMTGAWNMSATEKASRMEWRLGTMAWKNSVAKRAPYTKNPYGPDPENLKDGLAHYKENCLVCHAAPGVEESEIARGMNPDPPHLDRPFVTNMTDGQLFFTIKNGIRMTGMPGFGPTHEDEEIWKMVTFVRHLPQLTAEEKAQLAEGTEEEEHHHHGGAEAGESHDHHEEGEEHSSAQSKP